MEIEDLLYKNDLDVENFIHMLDDSTECYKIYWLDAIMSLFSHGNRVLLFDDVINKMIADAWYSVVEYHLHLGPKNAAGKIMNSLERVIEKLNCIHELESTATEQEIITVIKKYEQEIHAEKMQLAKMVPYRLLSSYFDEIGGNDKIWDQKKRMIAYIEQMYSERCIPYKIEDGAGLHKKVVINPNWEQMLHDNYVTITSWIELKKIRYLQGRNPGVPGIIYKLAPENEKMRKLKYVRELWTSIIEIRPVLDIYTNAELNKSKYDVDHFVPWSFIANDEMWNLMPMDSSLNSSKNNKLPNWEKYFKNFAENQFMMYHCVQEHEKIKRIFNNCNRDNLVSPWALEELYIEGCTKERFYHVLESNLKPIYEAARMQGYGVWKK